MSLPVLRVACFVAALFSLHRLSIAQTPTSAPAPLSPCTSVHNISVSALNGASAIAEAGSGGIGDLPTGLFVSAGDRLSYVSYSNSTAWCTYCANSAGADYLLYNYHEMALVFRYGNVTSDSNQADFTPVFTYFATPVTPQTAAWQVPSSVVGSVQLWLAAWDNAIDDNHGAVVVSIAYTPATCAVAASSSSSSTSRAPDGSTGAARVTGDPQFVGLRGQSFQVHGLDDAVYNLIVDGAMLVNARFRFLAAGRCPAVPQPSNCYSHPGSYLGEVGIVSADGDHLVVQSGAWDEGYSSVLFNGEALLAGGNVASTGMAVRRLSAHALWVRVGNFELQLSNSDQFVNLERLSVLQWSALSRTHGLLGQTWRQQSGAWRHKEVECVEGSIDEYVEQDNELLGRALVYGVQQ